MSDKTIMSIKMRKDISIEPIENVPNSDDKYVAWGQNNDYPSRLIDLYDNDSLLGSIIDTVATYCFGDGISVDDTKVVNKRCETLESVIKRCISDYLIVGMFSLQVCRNVYGKVVELYHVPIEKIRMNEPNTKVYYKKDWNKQRGNHIVYTRNDNNKSTSIFVFKNPKSRSVYGRPYWASAVNDVITNIEISKYNKSTVLNGFVPSGIINLMGEEPDEDTKRAIKKDFENRFTGADNASGIIINFVADKEHAATLESFNADNNSDRYINMRDTTRDSIMTACRVQPILLGSIESSSGFNSLEFESAFKLFQKTLVAPMQKEIENAFYSITENLGTDHPFDFKFKPFNIQFEDKEVNNG